MARIHSGSKAEERSTEAGPEQAPLGPHWYLSADICVAERMLFRHCGLPIARVEQVARPGDYVSGDLLGEPVAVVRGGDGQLRAFRNVCLHRGAELLRGSGQVRELVCPYHAWRYDLDGRLLSSPRSSTCTVRTSQLAPLEVETWAGGCSSGPRPRLRPFHRSGSCAASSGGWTPTPCGGCGGSSDVSSPWPVTGRSSWTTRSMGATSVHVHRQLARGLQLRSYESELLEGASVQVCTSRGNDARLGERVTYGWSHPGFFINIYGSMMDTNVVIPTGPSSCVVVFDWYAASGCDDGAWLRQAIDESIEVQVQDVAICESVQRGLSSPGFEPSGYSEASDAAIRAFHRTLREQVTGLLPGVAA